jgi:glycosyltransferase involved in cell wall biosynthesis
MNPVLMRSRKKGFQAYFHEKQAVGVTMQQGWSVGVVIPARNEELHIAGVLETLPSFVDLAVVINDGSTDATERYAREASCSANVIVLNTGGIGVGGAIDTGHQYLLNQLQSPFVSAVMAGDGQMNPEDLEAIISPVISSRYDHVKGDRSIHPKGYNNMPFLRKIASLILAFFTTLAAGQRVSDPQCGFTATSHRVLETWNWEKSWGGYGYPNFWLIQLARYGWTIGHAPVESIYRNETSAIKPTSFFIKVGAMMAAEHHLRNVSWVISKETPMATIGALIAYLSGWFVLLNELLRTGDSIIGIKGWLVYALVMFCWFLAHLFDRMATVSKQKAKKHATT